MNLLTKIEDPDLLRNFVDILKSKGYATFTTYKNSLYLMVDFHENTFTRPANDSIMADYYEKNDSSKYTIVTPGVMLDKINKDNSLKINFKDELYKVSISITNTERTAILENIHTRDIFTITEKNLKFIDKELAKKIAEIIF